MRRLTIRFGAVVSTVAVLIVGAVWLYATGTSEEPASAPMHLVRMLYDQKLAMRDGVKLSTDLYLPRAEGQYPTIVIRTPYDNNADGAARSARVGTA
jgi:predicted acyl esterase